VLKHQTGALILNQPVLGEEPMSTIATIVLLATLAPVIIVGFLAAFGFWMEETIDEVIGQ
jgi:nitrate reductase NapE component